MRRNYTQRSAAVKQAQKIADKRRQETVVYVWAKNNDTYHVLLASERKPLDGWKVEHRAYPTEA
jgi:hypothetical protein